MVHDRIVKIVETLPIENREATAGTKLIEPDYHGSVSAIACTLPVPCDRLHCSLDCCPAALKSYGVRGPRPAYTGSLPCFGQTRY
jgi:hypothetical protein